MTVNLTCHLDWTYNDVRETGALLGTSLRLFLERINCGEKSAFTLADMWAGDLCWINGEQERGSGVKLPWASVLSLPTVMAL